MQTMASEDIDLLLQDGIQAAAAATVRPTGQCALYCRGSAIRCGVLVTFGAFRPTESP